MSKYTLIGASGFVGTRLIDILGEANCINIDKNESVFFSHITKKHNICNDGLGNIIPKDTETVVLLAAEHRDDVSPTSLYYDVNVQGTKNVLTAMEAIGINKIIFTSSVAVYGLNKSNPDENHPVDPFNHYGKSKYQAEEVLLRWYNESPDTRSLVIIRPTVIFGERNRGNVYNLLRQMAGGRFVMIGKGSNRKSMAYVGNVAAFIKHELHNIRPGYKLYNYIDKPDYSMNELIAQVNKSLGKITPSIRLPYWLGYIGGLGFDLLSAISGKKYAISAIRVKKFCATTQFEAKVAHGSGFSAPFSLGEGLNKTIKYEFIDPPKDDIVFYTE